MATTNIDAVAEFKVLTNSYQAEYGRAVGAQIQVVTKSGSRDFHGSGYWYGRRSDWNANTFINKRVTPEIPKSRPSATTPGTRSAARCSSRASTRRRRSCSSSSARSTSGASRTTPTRRTRVPTALERRGDFSQSVDTSGNLFPYIRDYQSGLPCSASDTRGCFQDGGVVGRIPQADCMRPVSRSSASTRMRTSPVPARASTSPARRRTTRRGGKTCCAWTSRPPTTGASRAGT